MARKKRTAGRRLTDLGRFFPHLVRPADYGEYVGLVLNLDRLRVLKIMDDAQAHMIALGTVRVPKSWLDLYTDDPTERALWRECELRNRSPSPG